MLLMIRAEPAIVRTAVEYFGRVFLDQIPLSRLFILERFPVEEAVAPNQRTEMPMLRTVFLDVYSPRFNESPGIHDPTAFRADAVRIAKAFSFGSRGETDLHHVGPQPSD